MPLILGQGSGDFRETSGRVHIFHLGIRNSVGILTGDAFTQANPRIVTAANAVSTTLTGVTSRGVLGASIAFTRPDSGNGHHGGPALVAAAYVANQKPLGIYLNDAIGNAFENTPGVASGRNTYVNGQACLGATLWETQNQIDAWGGAVGTDLAYNIGDTLYASVNGLLTNRLFDAYEYNVAAQQDRHFVTIIGIVKVAPDADNSLMVLDLRV